MSASEVCKQGCTSARPGAGAAQTRHGGEGEKCCDTWGWRFLPVSYTTSGESGGWSRGNQVQFLCSPRKQPQWEVGLVWSSVPQGSRTAGGGAACATSWWWWWWHQGWLCWSWCWVRRSVLQLRSRLHWDLGNGRLTKRVSRLSDACCKYCRGPGWAGRSFA